MGNMVEQKKPGLSQKRDSNCVPLLSRMMLGEPLNLSEPVSYEN